MVEYKTSSPTSLLLDLVDRLTSCGRARDLRHGLLQVTGVMIRAESSILGLAEIEGGVAIAAAVREISGSSCRCQETQSNDVLFRMMYRMGIEKCSTFLNLIQHQVINTE